MKFKEISAPYNNDPASLSCVMGGHCLLCPYKGGKDLLRFNRQAAYPECKLHVDS